MTALILHNHLAPDSPPDQVDSLLQAHRIAAAIRSLGGGAVLVPFGPNPIVVRQQLRRHRPGVVVNLVEDVNGSSAGVAAVCRLLETLGIPFTGSGSRAMALTTDKVAAKRHMARFGIPAPATLATAAAGRLAALPAAGRWIVKPAAEDASVGLDAGCVCDGAAVVALLRTKQQAHGGTWFAEPYIDGREFNLSVLAGPRGPQVLPVAEMIFRDFPPDQPRILDYAAKWDSDSFAYRNTLRSFAAAPADRRLHGRLRALAHQCWHRFRLRGYARVDIRVDRFGTPWVLEINANPCLAPDAGFAAAAAQAGLRFVDVVRRILVDV